MQGQSNQAPPINEADNLIVQHALSGNNQRNDPDGEHFVVEVSRPLAFGQTIDHHDESQQTYVVGTLSGGQEGGFRTEPGDHLVAAYNWQSGGDVRLSFGKPNLQACQVSAVGVRRLTPTECERLQGFPDGWTEGQADSPRYRQLGNAVTVNVAEWIGRRIAKAHLGQERDRSRDQEGGIDDEKKDMGINADR